MTAFFIPGAHTPEATRRRCTRGSGKPLLPAVTTPRSRSASSNCRSDTRALTLRRRWDSPIPLTGHTVLAILDLGRHSPYLIHCVGGSDMQVLVRKPVYSVTEFSA